MVKLGVSKIDITPTSPIPLAGFAHRTGNFEGIASPLFARFFHFEKFILVTADVIWWDSLMVAELQKSWDIPLIMHATHNHSGPQTSGRFVPELGLPDPEYLENLKTLIHQGIQEAEQNLEEVTVEMGKGEWNVGINRRKIIDGKCEMAPNPEGPNDPTITVIKFGAKALLVHATCHPTTTGDNLVSAEFPGAAMELLEKEYRVAGFLQGFSGDIRPALVKNPLCDEQDVGENHCDEQDEEKNHRDEQDEKKNHRDEQDVMKNHRDMPHVLENYSFYRGDESDVKRFGLSLFNEVKNIHLKKIPVSAPKLISKSIHVPFSKNRGEAELRLTFIRLADSLCFLTANAEMVVEYGLAVKEIWGESVLPLGYTNGMVGYVPTAKQLVEGGYEPWESTYYFALPGPFSAEVEGIIKRALREESWL